ncbi:conserved protein of unknown function [Thauera humireducens]|nr:conserved protein of unknown function [Thauera humireducens]
MESPESPKLSITVILDCDPEVFRLGLGTIEGVERVSAYASQNLLELRSQPGVRVGVVVADKQMMIFAPVPLLVEAGSTSNEKPNALLLTGASATAVACAAGAEGETLPQGAEIGAQAMLPQMIEAAKEDLKRSPVQPFDLSRQAQVFSSKIQFVDFSVERYQMTQKTVRIPAHLMGLDGDLEERWRNSLRVLDEDAASVEIEVCSGDGKSTNKVNVGPKLLDGERKRIQEKYLIPVNGMGNVMFRKDQAAFDAEVKVFERLLTSYHDALTGKLQSSLDGIVGQVVRRLLPSVKTKLPEAYKRRGELAGDDLEQMLTDDINRAISIESLIKPPKVTKIYKAISYQSVRSEDFLTRLKEGFRKAKVPPSQTRDIFDETSAALKAHEW